MVTSAPPRLVLALALALGTAMGCGGGARPPTAPPAAALADPMNESIGGVSTGAAAAAVEARFGAPATKSEPIEMAATGEVQSEWTWPATGLTMAMAHDGAGGVTVAAISIRAPSTLTTSRGVGIGTSRAEVERIYKEFLGKGRAEGEPDTTTPEQLIVGSLYGGTSFRFTAGAVSEISVGGGAE